MSTKIREIRKLRGLTLQELADQVGTTPQTIQRLETDNMTVSVDWLIRIGAALDLPAASLLTGASTRNVPYVGDVGADGVIKIFPDLSKVEPLNIEIPGADPIGVRLTTRMGPHEIGTILIASRLANGSQAAADGRDCLVQLTGGQMLFRRIVHAKSGASAFVPYSDRPGIERNLDIAWLAPVMMAVRYLPGA